MSATILCPNPARCGARSHRAGTTAAIMCAGASSHARAAPPAPAPPAPAHFAPRDRAALARAELAGLASLSPAPSGELDPEATRARVSGELDRAEAGAPAHHMRQVKVERWLLDPKDMARVDYLDQDGKNHREGAPSIVVYGHDGAPTYATWYEHGQCHRSDGPSQVGSGADLYLAFTYRGRMLFPAEPSSGHVQRARQASEHYLACLAGGDTPTQAITWLRAASDIGARATAELREAAGEPDLLGPALDAGLGQGGDLELLTQVATGGLPLSWALAGLAR